MPRSTLVFAPAAVPAFAETPLGIDLATNLPYLEQATVAGGTLSVQPFVSDGLSGSQLLFNGQPVGLADTYVHIQAVIPRPEFEGEDLVLVTVAGGGNACPTLWAVVVTSAAGATASDPFGTCSEALLNPRLTEDGLVAVDMAPVADGQLPMTYTIDGADVREAELSSAP